MSLYQIQRTVINASKIPTKVVESYPRLNRSQSDVYVPYRVLPEKEIEEYGTTYTLNKWLLDNYPELESKTILIHIDY